MYIYFHFLLSLTKSAHERERSKRVFRIDFRSSNWNPISHAKKDHDSCRNWKDRVRGQTVNSKSVCGSKVEKMTH